MMADRPRDGFVRFDDRDKNDLTGAAAYKVRPDPLYDKGGLKPKPSRRYRPADFDYDPQAGTCICPAGKHL